MDQNHQEVPNRRGAEVARGTHNPEDTGSKPVAGIIFFTSQRCIKALEQPVSGVAQTVSARGGCVSTFRGRWFDSNRRTIVKLDVKRSKLNRGSSKWESAGLITPRLHDRSVPPVFPIRLLYQKHAVIAQATLNLSFRRCSSEEERLKHRLLPY